MMDRTFMAKLKIEVDHYLNNHAQINQDVNNYYSNTIFFLITNSLYIAMVAESKKKRYFLQDFVSHGFLMLLWFAES